MRNSPITKIRAEAYLAGQSPYPLGQPVEVQRIARQRPDQVGAAALEQRMQRRRMRHLALLEFALVVGDVEVQAATGHQPALVERIFVRMAQGDELVVALDPREGKPRHPAHQFDGRLAGAAQLRGQRRQLGTARHPVEAADADVDRVDLAPAEQADDRIAGLLQRQGAAHPLAVLGSHADRVRIAEKIGGVQHVHVQRVALDPFAAIEQTPQKADRGVDGDAQRTLDGVDGAHLVGDGANAADAGGDVGSLGKVATAQKGFEHAWRLEYFQLDVLDAVAL